VPRRDSRTVDTNPSLAWSRRGGWVRLESGRTGRIQESGPECRMIACRGRGFGILARLQKVLPVTGRNGNGYEVKNSKKIEPKNTLKWL